MNPCPFCASAHTTIKRTASHVWVACRECSATGPLVSAEVPDGGEAEAIDAWNQAGSADDADDLRAIESLFEATGADLIATLEPYAAERDADRDYQPHAVLEALGVHPMVAASINAHAEDGPIREVHRGDGDDFPADMWIVLQDTDAGLVGRVHSEGSGSDRLWESRPIPYHPRTEEAAKAAARVALGAGASWARQYAWPDRDHGDTPPTATPTAATLAPVEPAPEYAPTPPADPIEAPTTAPALRATVDLLRQRIAEAERRLDRLDWFAHSHPIAEIKAGRVDPIGEYGHGASERWADDA